MKIKQIQKLFEPFGISDREVQLYAAALALGEANMTQLSERSKISRTTCYEVYKVLEKRGWMGSYKTSQGFRYVATRPRAILQVLENQVTESGQALPYLNSLVHSALQKPVITHLTGVEGFKSAVMPSIDTPGNTVYHFGSLDATHNIFPADYDHKYYIKRRIENNVTLKCLYVDGSANSMKGRDHAAEKRILRWLPASYPCNGNKVIWDNTTVTGVMSAGEIIVTIVEHPVITQIEKSQFDLLWDFLEKS